MKERHFCSVGTYLKMKNTVTISIQQSSHLSTLCFPESLLAHSPQSPQPSVTLISTFQFNLTCHFTIYLVLLFLPRTTNLWETHLSHPSSPAIHSSLFSDRSELSFTAIINSTYIHSPSYSPVHVDCYLYACNKPQFWILPVVAFLCSMTHWS